MSYLSEWLNGLLRFENIHAIWGSLKRRVFKRNFLEMRLDLNNEMEFSPIWSDLNIRGYSKNIERQCLSVLNSVGSLDLWDRERFQHDILSTVDNPEQDIFLVCDTDSVIGITVLHKSSSKNNVREVGYVAVRPEHRGKKIGYKLLLYILAEAKKRRILRIFLKTDSFRFSAIKTYLNVGFSPYVNNENERKRWQKVMKRLGIFIEEGGG